MSVKPFAFSVKSLVRDAEGRFLAIRRSMQSKNNAGQWDLPGGKVDAGEDIAVALAREVQEETGLTIHLNRLFGASQSDTPSKSIIYLVFFADLVGGEVRMSEEHSEFRWATPDQLKSMDFCGQFEEFVRRAGDR